MAAATAVASSRPLGSCSLQQASPCCSSGSGCTTAAWAVPGWA
jgi:hypothetical protein